MKRVVAFAAVALCCRSTADVVMDYSAKPEDIARLHAARTLRCRFTADVSTIWAFGKREFKTENLDKKSDPATLENCARGTNKTAEQCSGNPFDIWYRDIDLQKGTAHNVRLAPSDVTVKVDHNGALWIVEGGVTVTSIFPTYAAGSQDFIVLRSDHSGTGPFASGHQFSGTCAVMDPREAREERATSSPFIKQLRALDDALETGAITKDEYDRKMADLMARHRAE